MKKAIFIILFVSFLSMIYGEVIILKDQDVIKGIITNQDENFVYIKTKYSDIKISKEKIGSIYFTNEEYEKSKLKNDERNEEYEEYDSEENYNKKKRNNKKNKILNDNIENDFSYIMYKKHKRMGVGFVIPGSILTAITTIYFVPMVSYGLIFSSTGFSLLFLHLMFGIFAIMGVIFLIASFVNFGISNKHFKIWADKFSLGVNANDKKIQFGLKFSF